MTIANKHSSQGVFAEDNLQAFEPIPHPWTPPSYGARIQYANQPNNEPLLPTAEMKLIQQIVGTLLYLARAVDPTILVALNDISSQQSKPTETTMKHVHQLLDYIATNPNPIIHYHASDMVLHIHSDGSYLSAPNARSRAAGHFFLSDWPNDIKLPDEKPTNNGPVFTSCKTIRQVLASAAETEQTQRQVQ